MNLAWPRGRYNGQRIVGVSFKITCDITYWIWLPKFIRYSGGLHWLCFRTFTHLEYDQVREMRKEQSREQQD